MSNRFTILSIISGILIGAILLSFLFNTRQELKDIQVLMRSDRFWHVDHLAHEQAKLLEYLLLYASEPSEDKLSRIEKALDFLWVRVDVLTEGYNRPLLQDNIPEILNYADDLGEYLEANEQSILEPTPETVLQTIKDLRSLRDKYFEPHHSFTQLNLSNYRYFHSRFIETYRRNDLILISLVLVVLFYSIILYTEVRRNAKLLRSAREANVVKSDFLANVSHELRTPLNGILGSIQLIDRTKMPPSELEHIRTLEACGKGLEAQISDILDFNKLEQELLFIEPHSFLVQPFLDECYQSFVFSAKNKGLEYTKSYKNLPIWLIGDTVRMRQVILNLLSNAIKYTEVGSIEFKVNWQESSQNLELMIVDTGHGIADEDKELIFEPFRQIKQLSDPKVLGSGLGLSIVKKLVEAMSGTVTVNSVLGVGSEFKIVLPLKAGFGPEFPDADEEATTGIDDTLSKSPEAEIPLFNDTHVLIAEDNPVNIRILQAILKRFGVKSTVVYDGKAAISLLMQPDHDFNLVLMDLNMPEMDGLQATEIIRENGNDIPIYAVTAYATSQDRTACQQAGMNGYISKPIKLQDIQEILENHRTADANS